MLRLEVLSEMLLLLVALLCFDSVPGVQFALAQPHSSPAADHAPSLQDTTAHTSQLPALSSPDASTPPQRRRFSARNRIRLPFNGSVNALPVQFACEFAVDSSEDFYRRYRNQLLCIEIDAKWRHCSPNRNEPPLFDFLPSGNHSAVAYLVGTEVNSERLLESEPIVFTVLHQQEYREYVERRKRDERARLAIEEDEDLLTWASNQANSATVTQPEVNAHGDIVERDTVTSPYTTSNATDAARQQEPPLILVIGVKTSVLRGFVSRQAIRATWASRASATTHGVKVFFVGCQPTISDLYQDQHQRDQLIRAIEMEKQRFGDLLTDELECEDSYFTLPSKVKQFLHFAATQYPKVPYVMIADDDIYLRLDRISHGLRQHGPRRQFYAGQVWAKQFLSPVAPMRNPHHKNYLPEAQYPMSALLPFVFGPHYVMSMDCAEYIGANRKELGDFMSLDDVSVALWLLALQVHPEHVPSFQNLKDTTCKEGFVSFADLTPHAIRVIHANLQAKAPFCQGFDAATWLKPDQVAVNADADGDEPEKPKRTVSMTLNVDLTSGELQVVTRLTAADGVNMGSAKDFRFDPSRDSFADHCAAITEFLDEQQIPYSDVSAQVRAVMTKSLKQSVEDRKVSSAFVELWRRNLQFSTRGMSPRPITIVYSRKGAYSKVLLECLFTAIYKENPVQVLDEATFYNQQSKEFTSAKEPDVFVFSILDGGINCTSAWSPPCQRAASQAIERYGGSSRLVMIAEEAWEVDGLDESVLLISTLSQVPKRGKHVYIPMASMAFGEIVSLNPMLLLASHRARRATLSVEPQPRKFCAYMYARCDRPQREYMFDLLNALEPVDALSVCQGSARQEKTERWRSRWSASAFEDAIRIYSDYKFVIAFENAQQQPGYVTEKIVTAFLAGSIPIYLGHSDSVAQLFNPRSFIDCGRFATLRKCAERVIMVHQSTELYERMLKEPVVGNVTLFHELFSWHPDVPSSFLASQVGSLLKGSS
ncbi:hypothetical protein Gpo141_00003028 [Globisporangium polare]